MMGKMKLASVVVAMLLFFAAVSGTGYALAEDSLPGEPLYGLKGALEQARVNLTRSPEARAELAVGLAEQRLEEVATMLQNGQQIDQATANQAQVQLREAEQAMKYVEDPLGQALRHQFLNMHQWAYHHMGSLIEDRPTEETGAMPQLLQFMSRTASQYKYQAGQGAEAPGTQTQTQTGPGGPPDSADVLESSSQLEGQHPLGPYGPFGPLGDAVGGYGYSPGPFVKEDGGVPPYQYQPGPNMNQGEDGYGPGPAEPPADAPAGPNQPAQPEPPQTGVGDGNGQPQNGTGPQGGTGGTNGQNGGDSGGGDSGGDSSGGNGP